MALGIRTYHTFRLEHHHVVSPTSWLSAQGVQDYPSLAAPATVGTVIVSIQVVGSVLLFHNTSYTMSDVRTDVSVTPGEERIITHPRVLVNHIRKLESLPPSIPF